MLRGKNPEERLPRLKLLMHGEQGVGKTMAAIQMPKPYIIDTEDGCSHYGDAVKKSGGAVFPTTDISEALEEIRALATEKHDYRTLIIDPFTTLYDNKVEEGKDEVGTDYGAHYVYANKYAKQLYELVTRIDMSVVMTAHTKKEYSDDGKVIGRLPDAWKKLPYLFDLVLYIERRVSEGRPKERLALVQKTRLPGFPDQEKFPWSYDELASRYGKDKLERVATQMNLASPEQVEVFNALLGKLTQVEIKRLKIDKAIKGYLDLGDMPAEKISKGIDLLKKHLASEAA